MAVTKRKRTGKPRRGQRAVFYQAVVWVNGVRVAEQCFDTEAAAHNWHDRTKARFNSGRGPSGDLTLGQVIQNYREMEFPTLTEGTRKTVDLKLKFLAESPAATLRMQDFNGQAVDGLIAWFLAHPRAGTATRSSFLKELKQLQVILGFYRDTYDDQFVSPVTRRQRRRTFFKGVPARKSQDYYLSLEQARSWFVALAAQLNPVYLDLARFQVIMGTRVGEAVALCWDAVDFNRKTISIQRTMDWVEEDGTKCRKIANRTKTPSSRRTLPMPPQVEAILKEARRRHPDSTVVFRNPNGSLLNYEAVRQAYNRAFEKAGLPWSGTHICRDTNATLAVMTARTEAVQVNLGHSSVRETEGYAKVHAIVENIVPATVANMLDGKQERRSRIKSRMEAVDIEKSEGSSAV